MFSIMFNYVSAVITDPGDPSIIKKNKDIDNYDSTNNSRNVPQCKKCQQPKPERSHHCSVCKRCVLKMDHHCPWIDNCVGLNNHRYFYSFLLWTCIGKSYSRILSPCILFCLFSSTIFLQYLVVCSLLCFYEYYSLLLIHTTCEMLFIIYIYICLLLCLLCIGTAYLSSLLASTVLKEGAFLRVGEAQYNAKHPMLITIPDMHKPYNNNNNHHNHLRKQEIQPEISRKNRNTNKSVDGSIGGIEMLILKDKNSIPQNILSEKILPIDTSNRWRTATVNVLSSTTIKLTKKTKTNKEINTEIEKNILVINQPSTHIKQYESAVVEAIVGIDSKSDRNSRGILEIDYRSSENNRRNLQLRGVHSSNNNANDIIDVGDINSKSEGIGAVNQEKEKESEESISPTTTLDSTTNNNSGSNSIFTYTSADILNCMDGMRHSEILLSFIFVISSAISFAVGILLTLQTYLGTKNEQVYFGRVLAVALHVSCVYI